MADGQQAPNEIVPEDRARFWFRLSCGMLVLMLIGIALTARGMILAFEEVAVVEGMDNAAVLASRLSEAMKWMVAGMFFFWPGVIVAIIGFWKKYVTPHATRRDEVAPDNHPGE